jgi:hypothetical protein
MNMKCECPDVAYGDWLPGATEEELQKIGTSGQKHVMCLSPGSFYGQGARKNTMPVHCTNMFNCNSIYIQIHDYILKYPKALRNLIKIVEKPCFYLKDMPDEEEDLQLYRDLDQLRGELHCDDNKRTHIVIYILDKEGAQSAQLVIPRIDTTDK